MSSLVCFLEPLRFYSRMLPEKQEISKRMKERGMQGFRILNPCNCDSCNSCTSHILYGKPLFNKSCRSMQVATCHYHFFSPLAPYGCCTRNPSSTRNSSQCRSRPATTIFFSSRSKCEKLLFNTLTPVSFAAGLTFQLCNSVAL